MLIRMNHRGACSCDGESGDGAGVLTGIPHLLYKKALRYEPNSFKDIQVLLRFMSDFTLFVCTSEKAVVGC